MIREVKIVGAIATGNPSSVYTDRRFTRDEREGIISEK
jgi:hypothetical protein